MDEQTIPEKQEGKQTPVLTPTVNQVPPEIIKQLKRWNFHARVLRISHFVLVLIATVCSVFAAAKLNLFSVPSELLAAVAAVAISLISAYDLGSKSNRMRAAWRKLNAAKIIYEADPRALENGKAPINILAKIYYEAEDIIGDVKE